MNDRDRHRLTRARRLLANASDLRARAAQWRTDADKADQEARAAEANASRILAALQDGREDPEDITP